MTGMLGGNPQEDMFAKLESMREIITEVNTQFKDAVSSQPRRARQSGACGEAWRLGADGDSAGDDRQRMVG